MFFGLQFVLIGAGYSAFNHWIGNYMVEYTGASNEQLGLFFIIYSLTFVLRPALCSLADRYQCHKRIYFLCALGAGLAYVPFVVLPFLAGPHASQAPASLGNADNHEQQQQQQQQSGQLAKFWSLSALHLVGTSCYSGSRAFADVLAVNYARRVGTDYGAYRRYGIIALALCSLLVGPINVNWLLPNYTLCMLIFSLCHLVLAALVLTWPDEHFFVISESQLKDDEFMRKRPPLAGNKQAWAHVLGRFCACCSPTGSDSEQKQPQSDQLLVRRFLSVGQQARILWTLVRFDPRLALCFGMLTLAGVACFSGQPFVQVALKEACSLETSHCNSSTIGGYLVAGICAGQLLMLVIASRYRFSVIAKLELALTFSLIQYTSLHYLASRSAYFYLFGSMHGLESFIMVLLCVEDGRTFASRVDPLIGELRRCAIIDERDDVELVRVSLAATMIALLFLIYEGLGAAIGRLALGFIIQRYGFEFGWRLLALMAGSLLVAVAIASKLGKKWSLVTKFERSHGARPAGRELAA